MIKSIAFSLFLILEVCYCHAQWSNNPTVNTMVSDYGSPIFAKLYHYNDIYYVTYLKFYNGERKLFLKMYDFNGTLLSPPEGIQISKNITDYYSAGFKDDAIYFATREYVTPQNRDVFLYKYALSGESLWEEKPIHFIYPYTSEVAKMIIQGGEEAILIAITQFDGPNENDQKSRILIHSVSPDGEILWNRDPVIIADTNFDLLQPHISVNNDGTALVAYLCISQTTSGQLRVTKIDQEGKYHWDRDVIVMSECIWMSTWPRYFHGRDGVLYISWHANACYPIRSMAYVQGIYSNGSLKWESPGLALSSDFESIHSNPKVLGISSDNNLIVTWESNKDNENGYRLLGQAISPEGEFTWDNSGLELLDDYVQYQASFSNDTLALIYGDPVYNVHNYRNIGAVLFDTDGNPCLQEPVTLNNERSFKILHTLSPILDGQCIAVFGEEKDDHHGPRLFLQNFWADGTLGTRSSSITEWNFDIQLPNVFYSSETGVVVSGIVQPAEITILDVYGRVMQKKKTSGFTSQITCETSNIANGLYLPLNPQQI